MNGDDVNSIGRKRWNTPVRRRAASSLYHQTHVIQNGSVLQDQRVAADWPIAQVDVKFRAGSGIGSTEQSKTLYVPLPNSRSMKGVVHPVTWQCDRHAHLLL